VQNRAEAKTYNRWERPMDELIRFAVVLTKQGVSEVCERARDFLKENEFFLCSSVTFDLGYLKIRAIDEAAREIQTFHIPHRSVAFVAERSEGKRLVGFGPDASKSWNLRQSDPGATLPPDD
jgi:hypothetical protein